MNLGKPISMAQYERWMDLYVLHSKDYTAASALFRHVYQYTCTPGSPTRWDTAWVNMYANPTGPILSAGMVLTDIVALREEDTSWEHALWQSAETRTLLLRANMRVNMELAATLVKRQYPDIPEQPKDTGDEQTMALFGPWKLAMHWRNDTLTGALPAVHDVLENSWWVYVQHSTLDAMKDKEDECAALLNMYPDSLGGALCFYIHAQPDSMYKEHMRGIFERPAPENGSVLFFMGLLKLLESYQMVPNPKHPWVKAKESWTEPCAMLEVFVSLYPSSHHAKNDIALLANSYEQGSSPLEYALPSLG